MMKEVTYRNVLIAGCLLLSACSGSNDEAVTTTTADSTTTESQPTTTQTTEAPTTTPTTLSTEEMGRLALARSLARAEAPLREAIDEWWYFPFDTSLGEAGFPFEFVGSQLVEIYNDLLVSVPANGQIIQDQGNKAIEIRNIVFDASRVNAAAEIDVCVRQDLVIFDAETGERLGTDGGGGNEWKATLTAVREDDEWIIHSFFFDTDVLRDRCVIGEVVDTEDIAVPPPPRSEAEIEQAEAEAKAEIRALFTAYTADRFDTSLGEEGLGLEFLTGPMYERQFDILQTRTAAGEVLQTLGDARIEFIEINVDLDHGEANITLCFQGDGLLLDAETGEELDRDDGDSWNSPGFATLVEGEWKIYDFYTGERERNNGGTECVFSE